VIRCCGPIVVADFQDASAEFAILATVSKKKFFRRWGIDNREKYVSRFYREDANAQNENEYA